MNNFEIPGSVKVTNPVPVDFYYGPWADLATAIANVPQAVRTLGLKVFITSLSATYIWQHDIIDSALVLDTSGGATMTAAQIKTAYESNADTNAFTNTYKTDLDNLATDLSAKVDKVVGFGLSSNDYTSAEKTKLSNLSEHFKGLYSTLSALQTAHPSGNLDGDYAVVDAGSGGTSEIAIWDSVNSTWDISASSGNVLSVNNKTGAVSLNTDDIGEGSTNKYFTTALVLATVITGLSTSTNSTIVNTDSILVSLGKLQAQVNAIIALIGSLSSLATTDKSSIVNAINEIHASGGGTGVPAGGTTGQILAKNSNTDYDDHWIDPPTGGSGYASRTFSPVLTFDTNFKMVTTQTGDIAFSLAASPVADVVARVIVTGDGVHACTFPSGSTNANAQQFDNTAKNVIDFVYDGYELLYAIIKVATPDVTPPSLLSAVISDGAKNQIVLSYSELLDFTSVPANADFSVNLGKSVASVAISGSLVTVTVDSPYSYGDVPTISYTPGGNPIQDPSHNHAAALSNNSITNNVLPGVTTMTIAGANQIPATSVSPTPLAFGSGGSSGTDTPISVSFWIKRAATFNNAIFGIGSITDNSQQNMLVQFDTSSGELVFQIFSGGGQMYITANTLVAAGAWTHVTLTYDGNKLASGQKVYLNGSSVPVTVQIASYNGQLAYISDTRLVVFAVPNSYNTGSPQEPAYNYLMSQLYFWNKELTSSDVSSIYNGGALVDPSVLPIHGNLVARYDLNGNLTEQINGLNLASSVAPTFSSDHP